MKKPSLPHLKKAVTLLPIIVALLLINHLHAQNNPAEPDTSIGAGTFNDIIWDIKIQSDEKILIGGDFTAYKTTSSHRLIRLNENGTIDNTFNIGTGANSRINSIAEQPDGKILIGGVFSSFNGVVSRCLARLNENGSVDNTFNIGSGASGYVNTIAVQKNGKILVGGNFTTFNGLAKNRLVRLNLDGTIDNTFNIGTGLNQNVHTITIQSNGKIIVGGLFTYYNGVSKNYILRLNEDGSIDNSFKMGSGGSDFIYSIVLQPDEKILVGGWFTSFNGISKKYLVRLNSDGSVDKSFNIGFGASDFVYSIAVQSDGKILVGGNFITFNGIASSRLIRLNVDGSVDNTFNVGTGADNSVRRITIQRDGRIFVAGTFTSFNNTSYSYIIRLSGDPIYFNTIYGKTYSEWNNDCIHQITEKTLPSIIIKAIPGPYYGGTDVYGNYALRVDSGSVNFTIEQELNSINSERIINQCSNLHNVSLSGSGKVTCCFNFADSIKDCRNLSISVQNSRMRRCFRNYSHVKYCNFGNSSASGIEVRVTYPSYIIPISSYPMWSSKQDSILTYDIGMLDASTCEEIIIIDSVVCGNESIRGLTQCIKATISPSSNCVAENPTWDRSSIKVTGLCLNASSVFTIKNMGSGNMLANHEYRVYVNDILIYTENFKLGIGEQFTVSYPSEGQTVRLEADQHPLHPGKSRPRAIIENCGFTNSSSRGLVTTVSQDDLDNEISIACNEIVDSFDPNDKQAMPTGIGTTHKILPGEEIEYVIRFQNTGTDTAYTVKVVDTLDVNLNVASFTEGTSSHPYTLQVSGKGKAVLTFNFYNINLPDSTTNKTASQGLVSYRVTVPSSTVIGTEIKNKAYIYFDYNSPIITNETVHTVDNTVDTDFSRSGLVQVGSIISGINKGFIESVKIYPNPAEGMITVEASAVNSNMEIRIFSLLGTLKKLTPIKNGKQQVDINDMNPGVYLYEIWKQNERMGTGLLQVR